MFGGNLMVDFSKKLKATERIKKVNPVEIYDTLDRRSETGPLRPAQQTILNNWVLSHKEDSDLIIKLHTGEGKTLIGLLVLLSKLNENKGPSLYICPNIYLVEQVCNEALKFGIPFCKIEVDNALPNDFLLGKKILITHVQKLFNGRSIFGIGNNYTPVGCVVLDDSHACIDSIKSSFTINIKFKHPLYEKIKTLFEDDLREQGEGSFYELSSDGSDTILPIPYWNWTEKKSTVLKLISEYTGENFVKFAWPLIKDNIGHCQAFISSRKIEISPLYIPISKFGTFHNANQRILMSATTQEDSFFIKGLEFSINAVLNPLCDPNQKWSGEKMILIPSLISDDLDRDTIINKFAKIKSNKFGIVALVPSFKKAQFYENLGALVANKEDSDMFEAIGNLKKGEFKETIVLANRYDGIDLPDKACRILILDSLPYFDSLYDQYEQLCRINSEIINTKISQKVEQGLGRSVRGEKDYSAIVIIGADLVKFIKSIITNRFFSEQTQKQIEIGMEIVEMAMEELEEDSNNFRMVNSLISQSLKRDEGWKEYYTTKMNSIISKVTDKKLHTILQKEKTAEEYFASGDYQKACSTIQNLIDVDVQNDAENGWYLQILARYKYPISKSESNQLQLGAFKKNPQLMKPKDGITYGKIQYIDENRVKRIKSTINKYGNYQEFMLHLDSLLSDLSFGSAAEIFERALKEIGDILGFVSQRPDNEIRKGPDNLWCGTNNRYLMFECKSEVDESRKSINKHEAGQMEEHCAWFENEYGDMDVKRILIIPTKVLSYEADFSRDIEIMRKSKLRELKVKVKSFIKEFRTFEINDLSEETITKWLKFHHLDIDSLFNDYSEKYYKK